MKPIPNLLVLASMALVALSLPASATDAPTVDDLVARHVAARGGLAKIGMIQTLRQTGRAYAGAGRQARVTREIKRPGRTRFEFTVQGVTAVYVSDGKKGWEVSPFDGDLNPRPLSDEVIAEAAEQADFEGPLVNWKPKGHRLQLVGREAVNGREAYKLKLTLRGGGVRYEYLDVKSLLLVRSDSVRRLRGRPVQLETTFGDYEKSAGVLFPHLIEIAAVGRPQRLRVVIEKVEVNPTLADARFEIPR